MKRRLSISEDEIAAPRFTIDREIIRQYRRYNATGRSLPFDFSHLQTVMIQTLYTIFKPV